MPFQIRPISPDRERNRALTLNLFERLSRNELAAAQKGHEGMIDRKINSVLTRFSERLQPRQEQETVTPSSPEVGPTTPPSTSMKTIEPEPEEVFGATQEAISELSVLGVRGQAAAGRVL